MLGAVLLGMVAVANASNALKPQHGLALAVNAMTAPPATSTRGQLYRKLNDWIKSENRSLPPHFQVRLHQRVVFHSTKAGLAGLLLAALISVSGWVSRLPRRGPVFAYGVPAFRLTAIVATPVLTVVLIANVQAALAPMTLTLLYG